MRLRQLGEFGQTPGQGCGNSTFRSGLTQRKACDRNALKGHVIICWPHAKGRRRPRLKSYFPIFGVELMDMQLLNLDVSLVGAWWAGCSNEAGNSRMASLYQSMG